MRDDLALLRAWRAGDRSAGNALVEHYFPAVYRFFRNKIRGDVEDLVQAVFLRCVESRDAVRTDASFRCYLFAIARNELFGHFRGRVKDPEALGSASIEDLDPGPSPTEALARHGEQRLLLQALRRLPLDDQILLELFYWEEVSAAELGAMLDIGSATARSRLRSARSRLDAALAESVRKGDGLRSTVDSLERWARSLREVLRADGAGHG